MRINDNVVIDKNELKDKILKYLKEETKEFFNQDEELTSFGWHQYDKFADGRYVLFDESLDQPDISGSLGELIYANNCRYTLQKDVSQVLKKVGKSLLYTAFGVNVDITIYRDGSHEINKEDANNRSMVDQLSES